MKRKRSTEVDDDIFDDDIEDEDDLDNDDSEDPEEDDIEDNFLGAVRWESNGGRKNVDSRPGPRTRARGL